jgi:hypothetical protein
MEKIFKEKLVVLLNKTQILLNRMAKNLLSSTAFGTGRSPQALARHGQKR